MDISIISPQIAAAAILMAVISLSAWLAGRAMSRHLGRVRTPLFALLVVLTTLYASSWVGRVENIAVFATGTAFLLSNLTPVLVSLLAGFAWEMPSIRSPRGAVVLCVLVTLGATFLLAPLLRPVLMPLELTHSGRWDNGLCLQTHDATCGPAAAATLLRHHGIGASEREMAAACLTSNAGTEPLALYHGLMKHTRDAGFSPRRASRRPQDWARLDQFPVLAMVAPPELDYGPADGAGSLRKLLGRASDGHAVVVLGRAANGDYLIGDPASGHITWAPPVMEGFFRGQAIYLQRTGD